MCVSMYMYMSLHIFGSYQYIALFIIKGRRNFPAESGGVFSDLPESQTARGQFTAAADTAGPGDFLLLRSEELPL